MSADERDPLLPLSGKDRARGVRVVSCGALVVGALVSSVGVIHSGALGSRWKPSPGNPLLAPAPKGSSQSRYTLHTACKSRALATEHASFFLDGRKEAYLVKHNYRASGFFDHKHAVKMTRQKLPSGNEYGYVLNTDVADFEYGFALKNTKTKKWLYEIGGQESPLAYKPCTQRYGSYFNRVKTLEPNPASIEYVFGQCTKDCDDYVDHSFAMKMSAEGVTIPTCGAGTVDLGEGDDARLFTLYHALFIKDEKGVGRSPTSRDSTYAESVTQARWLVHTIEFSDRSNMWVVALDVKLQDDHIHVCQSNQMTIPLKSECTYIDCSSSVYDVPSMQNKGKSASGFGLMRLQYTIARSGDARPAPGSVKFSNAKYLTDDVMYAAGTWGEDLDARRFIPISGGTCGQSIYSGHCVGMYTAVADNRFTATANEKRWILAAVSGHLKMVRIRVYVQNGALKVAAISAAYANSGYQDSAAAAQRGPYDIDTLRPDFDVNALFYSPVGAFGFADKYSSDGYGVGALKWMLAQEMVPSLA